MAIPKSHGRLIDIDEMLEDSFKNYEDVLMRAEITKIYFCLCKYQVAPATKDYKKKNYIDIREMENEIEELGKA